jgi:hypothetical protein
MRHAVGPTPPRTATTIRVVLTRMALLLVSAACTGPRPATNLTPTLIPQPTPDRTVDAVVRGRVTMGVTGTPGTPGTPAPRASSPVVGSGQSSVVTPVAIFSANVPTVGVANGAGLVTVAPGPAAATRTPTAATGRAVPEAVPQITPAATTAPARPTAVPAATPRQSPPTAAPPPTFGRAPGASGVVRP